MSRPLALGLWLWLFICLATAAAPQFDVSVSSHQIQEQETLRLILSFKQEADPYGSMISVPEIVVPPLVDFEILGRQTATSTVSVAGKMQMSTQTIYQLQPLRSGKLEIPALSVPYQEDGKNQEIHSTPIVIEVGGAVQSTPSAIESVDDPARSAPVSELESSALRQGILYAALALVIGSALFLLIYLLLFLRRRQALKPAPQKPVSKQPEPAATQTIVASPIATATPVLAIENTESPEESLEQLYMQVRAKLESQRLLPYPGASTQEIIVFLQDHKLPATEIEAVIQFLKKTQSLRFQADPPSASDLALLLDLAKKFI